jgi:hypothetical protein
MFDAGLIRTAFCAAPDAAITAYHGLRALAGACSGRRLQYPRR